MDEEFPIPVPRARVLLILDSNVLIADYWWRSTAFRLLLASLDDLRATVVLPEVVVLEVEARFKRQVASAQKQANDARRGLRQLTPDDVELPAFDDDWVVAATERFSSHLAGLAFRDHVRVWPMPQADHSYLAKRAVDRHRPHQDNGSGYRDDLIWHTVLDVASTHQGELVCLITDNIRDFASGAADSAALHDDLLDDLASRGLDQGKLLLFRSVNAFNSSILEPTLQSVEELLNILWEDIPALTDIADRIYENIQGTEIYQEDIPGLVVSFDSASFDGVYDPTEVSIVSAKVTASGEVALTASVTAEANVDFFVHKGDYWPEYESYADAGIEVVDGDWNDAVVAASGSLPVSFEVIATITRDKSELTSLDVVSMSIEAS